MPRINRGFSDWLVNNFDILSPGRHLCGHKFKTNSFHTCKIVRDKKTSFNALICLVFIAYSPLVAEINAQDYGIVTVSVCLCTYGYSS